MVKKVEYRKKDGTLQYVELPDGVSDSQADLGFLLGPPDLSPLNLPKYLMVRLNNELYHRGIITTNDAKQRRAEVTAAWQAALRVDSTAIINLYEEGKL